MFNLRNEIEGVLKEAESIHVEEGVKVIPLKDAKPITQVRWLKARVLLIEAMVKPEPKPRTPKTAAV